MAKGMKHAWACAVRGHEAIEKHVKRSASGTLRMFSKQKQLWLLIVRKATGAFDLSRTSRSSTEHAQQLFKIVWCWPALAIYRIVASCRRINLTETSAWRVLGLGSAGRAGVFDRRPLTRREWGVEEEQNGASPAPSPQPPTSTQAHTLGANRTRSRLSQFWKSTMARPLSSRATSP